MSRPAVALCAAVCGVILCAGCGVPGSSPVAEYNMGDNVQVGPLVYHVIEAEWKSQLGDFPAVRTPERRFLLVRLSVTNSGGQNVMVPQVKIEGSNGDVYSEVSDGTGLPNWLGLLRELKPAETADGQVLFDVPANTYRLRVSDSGDPEHARAVFVKVPLSFNEGILNP